MIVGTISSAAFSYVLLSPARRWFNADTPRQIHVDNGGVASVTGGDPDHGVIGVRDCASTRGISSGVNVTNGSSGNVSYNQGDGISDVIFSDPLHICTGTCLAATLTGYYSTSTTGTCGGLTVDKITDLDVAFNLMLQLHDPCAGELQQRDLPRLRARARSGPRHRPGALEHELRADVRLGGLLLAQGESPATTPTAATRCTTARSSRAAAADARLPDSPAIKTATAARTAARTVAEGRPVVDTKGGPRPPFFFLSLRTPSFTRWRWRWRRVSSFFDFFGFFGGFWAVPADLSSCLGGSG